MLFTSSLPSLNVIRFVALFYIRFRDQCLRSKARFIFNMLEFCCCLFVCTPAYIYVTLVYILQLGSGAHMSGGQDNVWELAFFLLCGFRESGSSCQT